MSNWVRWRRRWDSSGLPSRLELLAAGLELVADLAQRALDRGPVGGVVGGRPDADVLELVVDLAGERVEVLERLDLVAEEDRPVGGLGVGGEDLERLALDPERAAAQHLVVAAVLHVHELAQRPRRGRPSRPWCSVSSRSSYFSGEPEAVDAGHRATMITSRRASSAARGGVAQPVDLVVDRGVLLDVEVLRRDVRLGLVVVVVGDEVLDRVVGEELAELVAELRRQRLVVGDHQRSAAGPARS